MIRIGIISIKIIGILISEGKIKHLPSQKQFPTNSAYIMPTHVLKGITFYSVL